MLNAPSRQYARTWELATTLDPGASVPRRPMPPTKGPDVAASTPAAAACNISSDRLEEVARSDSEGDGGSGDEGVGHGSDDKKPSLTGPTGRALQRRLSWIGKLS
jgi:hypothetical protein